jgi:hypothetical protein
MGYSRPMHLVPVPINVRCYSNRWGKATSYPLKQANQALADLRAGRFEGAAVLVP